MCHNYYSLLNPNIDIKINIKLKKRCIVNHPSLPSRQQATPLPSPQARQEQRGGAEDSRDRPAVQQGGGGVLPGGDDRVTGEVSWANKVFMNGGVLMCQKHEKQI